MGNKAVRNKNKFYLMKALKQDIKLVIHGVNYYLLDECLRKKIFIKII